MSGSRTNFQLYWFQRYPGVFPAVPWNVLRWSSFLRIGVLPIRVGVGTVVHPPCRSSVNSTVPVAPVIILVHCRELHDIADSQTIHCKHIGLYTSFCEFFQYTEQSIWMVSNTYTCMYIYIILKCCPTNTFLLQFEWFKKKI